MVHTATEGIWVNLDRLKVGIRVGALRLVGGAAVVVPDGQLLHVLGLLVESLGLAPESLASPVNPDVESLHPAQNSVSITNHYFDIPISLLGQSANRSS